jgi:hypothetical protein
MYYAELTLLSKSKLPVKLKQFYSSQAAGLRCLIVFARQHVNLSEFQHYYQ